MLPERVKGLAVITMMLMACKFPVGISVHGRSSQSISVGRSESRITHTDFDI
jgi:hypothetical protein